MDDVQSVRAHVKPERRTISNDSPGQSVVDDLDGITPDDVGLISARQGRVDAWSHTHETSPPSSIAEGLAGTFAYEQDVRKTLARSSHSIPICRDYLDILLHAVEMSR